MMEMVCGYRVSQVIRAFAYFGIADRLESTALDAEALSHDVGADADAVARLLRAGAALGLVEADPGGTFRPTPLLRLLRTDVVGSMRGFALGFTASSSFLPFNNFVEAVRTGDPQAHAALGSSFFEHFDANPLDKAHFTSAMDGVSEQIADDVARVLDAGRVSSAVDVGGAAGTLLRGLLRANPGLSGTILETERVAALAQEAIAGTGYEGRIAVVSGDFLQSVPAADLYLLKWILHDWDDGRCVRILTNCREALHDGGLVAVVEMAVDDPVRAWFASLLDLSMLTLLGGRERTVAQYDALLARSGLVRTAVSAVPSRIGRFNVIQARAAR